MGAFESELFELIKTKRRLEVQRAQKQVKRAGLDTKRAPLVPQEQEFNTGAVSEPQQPVKDAFLKLLKENRPFQEETPFSPTPLEDKRAQPHPCKPISNPKKEEIMTRDDDRKGTSPNPKRLKDDKPLIKDLKKPLGITEYAFYGEEGEHILFFALTNELSYKFIEGEEYPVPPNTLLKGCIKGNNILKEVEFWSFKVVEESCVYMVKALSEWYILLQPSSTYQGFLTLTVQCELITKELLRNRLYKNIIPTLRITLVAKGLNMKLMSEDLSFAACISRRDRKKPMENLTKNLSIKRRKIIVEDD